MVRTLESDLAWHLAQQYRHELSEIECHTVFIHLGIEDYVPAIIGVLTALAAHRQSVPEGTLQQLHSWMGLYHWHTHRDLVDRVTPIRVDA
ncbi:hypothetical protein A5742_24350 [Mycolicibacterium fortuitum]|uniref:Uncharacterized protein n=1 Tax=Mycolicibacterium fortuitum TaxID=1766 RepID=A0ABD6QNV1_MYCFO|nr:hypothetical protein A5742_24350 [Mycolicibacterium fortuitum]